jgi:AbrB family looped-hinge helix DNA binding protein
MKDFTDKFEIYGIGRVGPKGQVVIPAEARHALGFKPGEKVVVAGFPSERTIIVMDNETFERHMVHMRKHYEMMGEVIKTKRKFFGRGKAGD